jgi:hypothetical protein
MKRERLSKMHLSKETLRRLEDRELREDVVAGVTTNGCTNCTGCTSCFNTCMLENGMGYCNELPTANC